MLTEAQIERYSRQIVLPEVGGGGQERLLAARVVLAGDGPAAEAAATFLGRAGVGALHLQASAGALSELSPDCQVSRHAGLEEAPAAGVVVDLTPDTALSAVLARRAQAGRPCVLGALSGAMIFVLTLVGRPCVACLGSERLETRRAARGPLAAPALLGLGALAANEALRVLLLPPARGRLVSLGLESAIVSAVGVGSTAGCAFCGGRP